MLSTATTSDSLAGSLSELLAGLHSRTGEVSRTELRDRLAAVAERSETVSGRAFGHADEDALEDAHRCLYSLYAERVWRSPVRARSDGVDAELDAIRRRFERGLLESLDARRANSEPADAPDPGDLAGYFAALATAPQSFDGTGWGRFVRDEITLDQLRRIVAQRSLFFLREPDPWIFALPTLTGVAKAGLIDLLLDEYGWGKLDHMHSSVYARLMNALDLDPRPDAYEAEASWQYLATLNHQWMLALTPGLSRRLLGTIYLTEADSPSAMANYLIAWERLGVTDPEVLKFYEIHICADENHRDVALGEVLLPVCEQDPAAIAEIAAGIVDARTLEADFASACRVVSAF